MKRYLYVILFFVPVVVIGQSTNQNYIKTTIYKKASTSGSIDLDSPSDVSNEVVYFDGLGRPIQQVAHKQSETGKDIITHIEYDEYGRQLKEYLPYPSTSQSNMAFVSGADSEVISYYQGVYGDSYPFSEKQLEASPLGRVLKQGAPGAPWQLGGSSDKSIKFSYQSNASNEVKYFYATTSASPNSYGVYTISLANYSGGTYYSPNQLYKTITTDENGSQTVEYKDKEGRVVLKRAYNGTEAHDTYYVYDIYGNLTYVIPPKAVDLGTITNTVLNDLCYQYVYDSRNRLVEKKLPGKGWEFIVYDKLDRVVATGPALSPFSDVSSTGWLVTKYDVFGRVAYTGWNEVSGSFDSTTRNSLQNSVNSMTNLYVTKQNSTIDGVTIGYSNNSTLPSITKLLTVNYYDNYSYPNAPGSLPTDVEGQAVATNVKGLATGSWVRILTTSSEKLNELSYTLYDLKGRPIRVYQKNYLGGYTQVDTKLNFIGTPEYTLTKHKRLTGDTEISVREDLIYSPQGRLREHKHKINNLTEETLSYNEYDELGQLKKKKVGRTSSTPLQEVDYLYNIRGWLTDINNVDNLGGDLFGFKISYENPLVPKFSNSYKALYNGNISETYWKSSSDNVLRKYGYSYDGLNRLNASLYMKPMTSQQRGMDLGSYNEHINYDKNGNINTLFRNGDLDSNLDVIVIDDLEYTYDSGNKLLKVIDNSNHPEGFKDGANSGNDYVYDDFGNMTQDLNKGINSITYNHLNLPKKITYSTSNQNISYLYNALGVKVQKKVFRSGIVGTFNPDHTVTTDYLSGFHYEFNDNPNLASSGGLVFFATSEGYVNITTGKFGNLTFNYVYNYTDHLGNVRVSYTSGTGGVATILEENHYYPFGLKHKKYGSTVKNFVEIEDGDGYFVGIEIVPPGARKTYQYKYNGKELQDELNLNVYDYGARMYMPDIGRWGQIDPLAEFGRRWSPYTYAMDNPVYFIDPDGMWSNPNPFAWLKQQVNSRVNQTKKDIKEGWNSFKESVSTVFEGTPERTSKDGGTDFYSKNGGGQGPKTTGKVDEMVNGDDIMSAAGFANAPAKGAKNGKTDAKKINPVTTLKKNVELFQEGKDGAESVKKVVDKVISSMESQNTPETTTVNVKDTFIYTDYYQGTYFSRTGNKEIKVEVPNNQKSVDSVKQVYENKQTQLTNKVNKQWD